MFEMGVYALNTNNLAGSPKENEYVVNRAAALRLYQSAAFSGQLNVIFSRMTGRQKTLLALSELRKKQALQGGHHGGLKTVSLNFVKGSEGRSEDFDPGFRPLKAHNRQRWINVAKARLDGKALPPVDLVLFKGDYYVRDGHHRISVARALGQEAIEAFVTELD
jgi:hypothetical protein